MVPDGHDVNDGSEAVRTVDPEAEETTDSSGRVVVPLERGPQVVYGSGTK